MNVQNCFELLESFLSATTRRRQTITGLRRKVAAVLFGSAVVLSTCYGQPRTIDSAKSVMTVRVYKSGVFSAFGHDHEIAAPVASGSVDANSRHVELHVKAAALRVQDPNTSEKDRAEIQKTMLGPEVLDVDRYPEISFRAQSAERAGEKSWTVNGDLTLHGQTHPVAVTVREQNGHYLGDAQLRQTDFGMKPIKVAGGTVKVKDQVRVEFDIQLAP